MNQLLKIADIQHLIREGRNERMRYLFERDISFLPSIHKPYSFLIEILKQTRKHILSGNHKGRWDIGVGGGKTALALSMALHVAKKGGKILFLTPGNVELVNAVSAHTNKCNLGENNLFIFSGGDDMKGISSKRSENAYKNISFYYSTSQMLTYEKRYKHIPFDFFDIIFIDEAHDLMGDILSEPMNYFQSTQIYLSATPYNLKKHLGNTVPFVYGSISSQELIDYYGFPGWYVKNYKVDEIGQKKDTPSEGEFDFENKNVRSSLNISKRFLILESILEEIVLGHDKKGIAYMPSVHDAEIFVKYIVESNDILRGKVDYVAGKRGKSVNTKVESALKSGKYKVVLTKDLWNQSLDIPEITDVILNDPIRSPQTLIQRIGRGARPSPGKSFLTVHDIVSSYYHTSKVGIPAVSAESIVRENTGLSRVKSNQVPKVMTIDPSFIESLERRRQDTQITLTYSEVEHRESFQKAYFLSDPSFAVKCFGAFASRVYFVSYKDLLSNKEIYKKDRKKLVITYKAQEIILTLEECIEISEFYGTFEYVEQYNFIQEIVDIVKSNVKVTDERIHPIISATHLTSSQISDILEKSKKQYVLPPKNEVMRVVIFNEKKNYVGILNEKLQKLGGKLMYRDRTITTNSQTGVQGFYYELTIEIEGKSYIYKTDFLYTTKSEAKQALSKYVLETHDFSSGRLIEGQDKRDYISELNLFIQSQQGSLQFSFVQVGGKYRAEVTTTLFGKENYFSSQEYVLNKKIAKNIVSKRALEELKDKFGDKRLVKIPQHTQKDLRAFQKELDEKARKYYAKIHFLRKKPVEKLQDGFTKKYYEAEIKIILPDSSTHIFEESGFFDSQLDLDIQLFQKALDNFNPQIHKKILMKEKETSFITQMHSFAHYNGFVDTLTFEPIEVKKDEKLFYRMIIRFTLDGKEYEVLYSELSKDIKSAKNGAAELCMKYIFYKIHIQKSEVSKIIISDTEDISFESQYSPLGENEIENILDEKSSSLTLKSLYLAGLISFPYFVLYLNKDGVKTQGLRTKLYYPHNIDIETSEKEVLGKSAKGVNEGILRKELLAKILSMPGVGEAFLKYVKK